ncbi:alpha-N-methyltransferase NTM1 [Dendryphion nanum]|uniref:Alpha N-terminal protein methyltransferase 1 n=1 Tax=Dendryphion nanum TaxID=256645 RepID=A0A9P9D4F5_9PLEO|nr:alpha-N-methyltransferase NTM1 [Dendryphion nanum]
MADSSKQSGDLNSAGSASPFPINQSAALSYWSSVPMSDDGMLGGYGPISQIDLDGSSKFLTKLNKEGIVSPAGTWVSRAVDFGAGFGRITAGLLMQHCDIIDVVEPVAHFTTSSPNFETVRSAGRLGDIYNVGLESFHPKHSYNLIWSQWCLGQLTDEQLVSLFARCVAALKEGGIIVVKENVLRGSRQEDEYDDVDSSVTRLQTSWTKIFSDSRLRIIAEEVQKGFPRELYPVMTWALQPI